MSLSLNRYRHLAPVILIAGTLVGCKSMPFSSRPVASKTPFPKEATAETATPGLTLSSDESTRSTGLESRSIASTNRHARLPVDFDPVREVTAARSPAPANFAPRAMNPLSPIRKTNSNDVPPAYERRLDELDLVGKQLTSAAEGAPISFDVLYNPKRVATCHSASGDIYVTSALIEKIESRHQLAVALAVEMAKYLDERKIAEEARSRQVAGIPENATLNGIAPPSEGPSQAIEESASAILAKAGFDRIDFEKVKNDVDVLVANAEREIRTSPARNIVKGPSPLKPVAAN